MNIDETIQFAYMRCMSWPHLDASVQNALVVLADEVTRLQTELSNAKQRIADLEAALAAKENK